MVNELDWIKLARGYIGLRENTSKTEHHPTLLAMLKEMGRFSKESKAWWADDETPWCGLFVGYVLGQSGRFVVREWYRAKAWESDKMTKLGSPAYGCIVTFNRDGGGHVGFVVGIDKLGRLMVLGGNQGNMVSIAPFEVSRVTGYYWPSYWQDGESKFSIPANFRYDLPIINSAASSSRNEA